MGNGIQASECTNNSTWPVVSWAALCSGGGAATALCVCLCTRVHMCLHTYTCAGRWRGAGACARACGRGFGVCSAPRDVARRSPGCAGWPGAAAASPPPPPLNPRPQAPLTPPGPPETPLASQHRPRNTLCATRVSTFSSTVRLFKGPSTASSVCTSCFRLCCILLLMQRQINPGVGACGRVLNDLRVCMYDRL